MIDSFFPNYAANFIKIQKPNPNKRDVFKRFGSGKGPYLVMDAYITLINDWAYYDSSSFWNKLWKENIHEKHKILQWKNFKGELSTKIVTTRFNNLEDINYTLCNKEREDIEYLFIKCETGTHLIIHKQIGHIC